VALAHLPTPLEPLPRLSAALGQVDLRIKRDDCTGLALGGNKARQLEFTLGDALAGGADCVVQGAAAQSNHCRQAAAACARLGLECHLLLQREERPGAPQGNLLLDVLCGAVLHWTGAPLGEAFEAEKERLADGLRSTGRRPYVIGGERGRLLGAAAYALAACELVEQCDAAGWEPEAVYLCASAAKTGPGLLAGLRALGRDWPVRGVLPIRWDHEPRRQALDSASALAGALGLDGLRLTAEDVRLYDEYVGPGYGLPSREAQVALELAARTEGILLEPTYTAKALAGLVDHVRRGTVRPGTRVVFLHTGGLPGLFAGVASGCG
jgi:1-aminocyclopropane-1-carboxylate deaminase/D-cysteine desulfhydrase-like pyridoxal-dependent ACC family enzyme